MVNKLFKELKGITNLGKVSLPVVKGYDLITFEYLNRVGK